MKRILVVDDEAVIRSLAELSLRCDDWDVVLAPDGWTALAEAEAAPPDLILLDLGLPGMSGQDLARRFRADPATAGVPIIYMTGYCPPDCDDADAVLSKPFTPQDLRLAVEQWLVTAGRPHRLAG